MKKSLELMGFDQKKYYIFFVTIPLGNPQIHAKKNARFVGLEIGCLKH